MNSVQSTGHASSMGKKDQMEVIKKCLECHETKSDSVEIVFKKYSQLNFRFHFVIKKKVVGSISK